MSRTTDKSWLKVREIFDEALKRQTPEERQNYVREACGRNKTLKKEVESLLASLDNADSFLETSAVIKIAGDVFTKERQFENGQILAHYEIIEKIGAGGMGEVYLAADTKLNRRVAIKILRKNLLPGEQANRRLLREARAAAKLEHPAICAIYEVSETEDGAFIVMQYAEGETLADILIKQNLNLKNALNLAIQIADALAEAHSRGIIHRDIKPANIIINEKNQAKILDFGLAKFIEAESNTETTERLKSSGAVMGTVPFMSPEQLRGKRLDARTDIFSFGVVFYEMIAGRQVFGRENNAETIAAILNDEPDFAILPEKLQPILRKCLAKNKDMRYVSANDLLEGLRELQKLENAFEKPQFSTTEDEDISTLPTETVVTDKPKGAKKRQFYFWQSAEEKSAPKTDEITKEQTAESKIVRRGFSPVFVGLTIFSLIGAFGLFYWQLKKSDDLYSFDKLRSVRLVSWKSGAGGTYSDYRVSHNGKMMAYSSSQDGNKEGIFVKQTTDGAEIRVTRDEWNNFTPIWSPDDQRIAFASAREAKSVIYSIPVFGGVAVPYKTFSSYSDLRLRHWSKDGTGIFYESDGNLFRLEIATQDTIQITNFAPENNEPKHFSISPDEKKIVYMNRTDGQSDLWMSAISGGNSVRLTNDPDEESNLRWHTDGERILYTVHRNNYYQINIAYTDGRTPRQVTRGESEYELIDVSEDGKNIYYLSKESKSDIWGVKIDTGEEFETATGIESEFWTDVSKDGSKIAYQTLLTAQTFSFTADLTIVVKSLTNQFPPLLVKGYNPRWLPDNRHLAFLRWHEKKQKFELRLLNTINGEEQQITAEGASSPGYSLLPFNRKYVKEYSFSPDSRQIAYLGRESGFSNIFIFLSESGETVNITKNTNPNVQYRCPLFSPDGKRIVFMEQPSSFSSGEKLTSKILVYEQDSVKEIYSTVGDLRLLGSTMEGEIILQKSDPPMSSIQMDIMLLRISVTGEMRFETVLKNIYTASMCLSADGKTVIFTARQEDKDNIFTASTKSGAVKKHTANSNSKIFYGSPTLSPDGKTIFFDKQEETNIISRLENFN